MLEIRHVTKIYKTKGGVTTKALDDVSISFAETGLVFLLGKSGSGKSTLLNVSGGLDDPTEGEVIVKGKSSKSFSGADFDSYRNTFVGFVFQEYNVLDEFNVEDNIALALELQGKPKDREKIKALLDEVDLGSYAKRKPNTLSGGQKQRIAIARALIKDPQIIMADEPTGALDSATGKQVFDTLKKLSETRLVIVVSHDREFAEQYGDRIVELKDGKIISDVTKRSIAPEAIDGNLSVVGGDTLTIKSGSGLTQANIAAINEFLKKSDGDIIITRGEKEKIAFRKATRMSDEGATESFSDTASDDVKVKQYGKEDSKFIRSRLPAGKAIKIGASGLKLKPIRLFFTIFLSFVAFTMFGLFSTLMLYDGETVAASSFANSGIEYLDLGKKYTTTWHYSDGTEYTSSYGSDAGFTPAEVSKFAKEYNTEALGYYGVNTWGDVSSTYSNVRQNAQSAQEAGVYYIPATYKFAVAEEGSSSRGKITEGKYPEKDNEIAISSYLADTILNSDYYAVLSSDEYGYDVSLEQTPTQINGYGDIVGKSLVYGSNYSGTKVVFTVSGVFDSGEVSHEYDELKTLTRSNMTDEQVKLLNAYYSHLLQSLHTAVFVAPGFYQAYKNYYIFNTFSVYVDIFDNLQNDVYLSVPAYESVDPYHPEYIQSVDVTKFSSFYSATVYEEGLMDTYFFDGSKKSLSGNEIIINFSDLACYEVFNYLAQQYVQKNSDKLPFGRDEGDGMSEEAKIYEQYGNYWNYRDAWYQGYYDITTWYWDDEKGDQYETERVYMTKKEVSDAVINLVKLALGDEGLKLTAAIDGFDRDMTVVGFFDDGNYGGRAFVSQSIYDSLDFWENSSYSTTNYKIESDAQFSGVLLKYDGTESTFIELLKVVGADNRDENDVFYDINNELYQSFDFVNGFVSQLTTVFMWIGIVFAVFASLLMFNFISMSISNKRKEIGILRAVGARGTDVFKIFFAESGIIVGICLVLSVIGSVVASMLINNAMMDALGMSITLFVFGWISVLIMLALALVVALISTFLPVYFAARKKPIESIRAL